MAKLHKKHVNIHDSRRTMAKYNLLSILRNHGKRREWTGLD